MGGTAKPFKREPDRWRLRVDAGTHPVTGKRRRLTRVVEAPWGRPGAVPPRVVEIARAEMELEADLLRGDPTALDGLTVAILADRFLAHRGTTVRHSTLKSYRHHIALAVDTLGNMEARAVRPVHLDHLYAKLSEKHGASVVVKVHRALKAMFSQAVRWQVCVTNPVLGAVPPSSTAVKVNPPSPDVLAKALDAMGDDIATFARIAAWTGARRAELCALTWDRIDLDEGTVTIDRALHPDRNGVLHCGPTKTGNVHMIAIGPKAVATLTAHRERLIAQRDALGLDLGPWVFPNRVETDALPSPDAWTLRWTKARKDTALASVRLHDLRHYAATQMLAAGVDPVTAAGRLGHSTPAITMRVYAAWLPARDRAAAELLESLE